MVSPSNLLSLALLYVCVLFAVAWYADRKSAQVAAGGQERSPYVSVLGLRVRATTARGIIYALSLAVYCSSWTFYGAVGSATASAWSHAPIYLGPILVFTVGWPLIRRLLAVGARHQVTSIADYIGARFGKRQPLAVLVTFVATAAVLPYIALQFKALAQAWVVVGGTAEEVESIGGDTALLVAIILAIFTILFGTRRMDGGERHQGIMTAVAVESVVKLLAFIAVAVLALVYLSGAPETPPTGPGSQALGEIALSTDFIARTLISALAIVCLPRQFHVMVVEAGRDTDTRFARWVFPIYLALFMLLVVPISLAGAQVFGGQGAIRPDVYVQVLPIALESDWVVVAAFIGGISAATGMVIVATVALAIMITNEVVAPLVMRLNADSPAAVLKLGDSLRRIRQYTIVGILLAAWVVTRLIMGIPWLAQIGFISFLAAAQLAPALLAGLFWRKAHGVGVIAGLLAGVALWLYCGVLPAVLPGDHSLLVEGLMGLDWLRPMHLLGIDGKNRLAYATAWSLGINTLALLVFSFLLRPSRADIRQARLFMGEQSGGGGATPGDFQLSLIRVSQLQALLPPFMSADEMRSMWRQFEDAYQQRLLPGDRAPVFVVNRVESVLARIIGTTSAHQAMEQLERSRQLDYSDLAGMVTDASRLHTFNRELLQTTVESLTQGVSVVDGELRLVAWNQRYEEMFHYPERFLYVGCPIERVYRFNAERGLLGAGRRAAEEDIQRRLRWLREGSPYRLERSLPDGKVVDIRGNPLPHGGFVTTYFDITDYREVTAQLEEARLELEAKIASGSQTLSEANARLRQENRLRAEVESRLREAHRSKTRFMSATSHDLLQPINAARLFTAALKPQLAAQADGDSVSLVEQIDASLQRAEKLIAELREIARVDSGRQLPRRTHFSAHQLLTSLEAEFRPQAAARGLRLRVVPSTTWLYSDQSLVYRMLQNLLSNAIKYTPRGRVLLGLRRRPLGAEIQVWDTGPGVAEPDRVRIFEEFERLQRAGIEEGLGLGLAIVQRYSDLLGHRLRLESRPDSGSMFSLQVTYGQRQAEPEAAREETANRDLESLLVACLDNDPLVLDGMARLLAGMGAQVITARDREQLLSQFAPGCSPDIVLADYHLDDGETGLEVLQAARHVTGADTPAIIISADDSDVIRDRSRAAGYRFLPKPVDAVRLRALVLAMTRDRATGPVRRRAN